jgi:hypothetical protein
VFRPPGFRAVRDFAPFGIWRRSEFSAVPAVRRSEFSAVPAVRPSGAAPFGLSSPPSEVLVSLVGVDETPVHDQRHDPGDIADVVERARLEDYEIGQPAHRHLAELFLKTQRAGSVERHRAQRLRGGKSSHNRLT